MPDAKLSRWIRYQLSPRLRGAVKVRLIKVWRNHINKSILCICIECFINWIHLYCKRFVMCVVVVVVFLIPKQVFYKSMNWINSKQRITWATKTLRNSTYCIEGYFAYLRLKHGYTDDFAPFIQLWLKITSN